MSITNTPILAPITVTADTTPAPITLPAAADGMQKIALHVHESAGVVELVSDAAQTKGVTIEAVIATSANFLAGEYLLDGLTLYAYASAPTVITFIPVLLP